MQTLCRRLVLCAVVLLSVASWAGAQDPPNNLLYQIFVRSFADSDNDAKGVGDLRGITQRLDSYLNDGKPETDHDLEVGMLWLMPIFPTDSY
ncbi:MAG: alpha-amylase, partial [Planctomycetes bacterium]|nr:alpha-amylase [Planctomycetota bacterium]